MEHTYESLTGIHLEKSGRFDHRFTGHDIDHIVRLQGPLGQPLPLRTGTTFELFGAAIEESLDEYRWKLKDAPSEILREGKHIAAKFRRDSEYGSLIQTLIEADALVTRDRRRIIELISDAASADIALEKLFDLLTE